MRSPLLSLRLGAFVLDATLLSMLFLAGLTWVMLLDIPWTSTASLLLVFGICGYFALSHWYFDGQSFGKRLSGVRVERLDGQPLSAFDAVLRAFSVVMIPIAIALGIRTATALFYIPSLNAGRLNIAINIGLYVVWPISILLSLGASSIHDFAAGTGVRAVAQPNRSRPPLGQWQLVAASVILSLVVASVIQITWKNSRLGQMLDVAKESYENASLSGKTGQGTFEASLLSPFEGTALARRFQDYSASLRSCDRRDRFSTRDDLTIPFDSLPSSPSRSFNRCVDVQLISRCQTISSFNTLVAATSVIGRSAARLVSPEQLPGVLILFDIKCKRNLAFVTLGLGRTLLGFFAIQEGAVEYQVAEPDRPGLYEFYFGANGLF